MLLIVACHFIIHFNWNTHHYDLMLIQEPGWTNALKFLIVQYGQVGVSIFFIISGYFLVDKTFKRRRIFKTWFQMFCYSSGFFITLLIIGVFYKYPTVIQPLMQGSELFRTIAASFFPFFYGSYWFISAYILMLLCAPFINSLCQSLSKRANLSLLVLFSFKHPDPHLWTSFQLEQFDICHFRLSDWRFYQKEQYRDFEANAHSPHACRHRLHDTVNATI